MASSDNTVQKEAIAMPTRNVVLTDHQDSLVDRLVKSGRYQNASEVLREGLRLMERADAENRVRIALKRLRPDRCAGNGKAWCTVKDLRFFCDG
jgi:putative addiction module CopG family antidote